MRWLRGMMAKRMIAGANETVREECADREYWVNQKSPASDAMTGLSTRSGRCAIDSGLGWTSLAALAPVDGRRPRTLALFCGEVEPPIDRCCVYESCCVLRGFRVEVALGIG